MSEEYESLMLEQVARVATALERVVALLEPRAEAEAARSPMGDDTSTQDLAPTSVSPTSDTMPPPPPPRRLGLVVDNDGPNNGIRDRIGADAARARTTGAAHGISNMLFHAVAPAIVRRLLRDERSVRHGLLTTTIDAEADIRPERRTRVLERLRLEEGFVETVVRKGVPGVVRITDEARARAWLAAQGARPRAEER